MESRIASLPAVESRGLSARRLADNVKTMAQRVQQKTVERAKVTDTLIRDHPYQTIAVALGVGLLIGFLARRR